MASSDGSEASAATRDGSMDELYRRYSGWLKAMLRLRFTPDQAEDLAHEAYIRVARYQAAGEIRHPQGLLLRIAENLAYNQARRAGRERAGQRRLAEATQVHASHAEPEQAQAVLLRQVLDSLPATYRDVFMLNRHAGLTYEQIAAHCDLPVKTVEWRMSKALALIAARIRN